MPGVNKVSASLVREGTSSYLGKLLLRHAGLEMVDTQRCFRVGCSVDKLGGESAMLIPTDVHVFRLGGKEGKWCLPVPLLL